MLQALQRKVDALAAIVDEPSHKGPAAELETRLQELEKQLQEKEEDLQGACSAYGIALLHPQAMRSSANTVGLMLYT